MSIQKDLLGGTDTGRVRENCVPDQNGTNPNFPAAFLLSPLADGRRQQAD